jgi:hypothetical protein
MTAPGAGAGVGPGVPVTPVGAGGQQPSNGPGGKATVVCGYAQSADEVDAGT